ncbi:MAG: PAS domain S-box protein [Pseudomonadota bacterium]
MADNRTQVLLVEDSLTDALFVQDALVHAVSEQFAVTHVERLNHALEQLQLQHFDVVLLDLNLPDSDGFETFTRLYNAAENIPVVLLTNRTDESLALQALQAGAQDYLIKERVMSEGGVLPRAIRYAIERRRSQQASHASEEQLRDLFDNTSDFIQSIAPDGRILFANRAWREMLGYSEEEMTALNIFDVIHADHHEHCGALFQRLMAGEDVGAVECTFQMKDGRIVAVEGRMTVRFEDGQPVAVRGIYRDVTKRNQIMAKLQALTAPNIRKEERASISREIHDELGGTLTVLKMDLDWLAKKNVANPMYERIRFLHQLSGEALDTARRISRNLRPSVLDNLSLSGAIEWLAHEFEQRLSISCQLTMNAANLTRLDQKHETEIFRIIQEAFTNIARHAQATAVEIDIDETDEDIVIEIRDNGIGITQQQLLNPKSFGILGMYERTKQLNGKLRISGAPSQGSTVQLRVPLIAPPGQVE